MRAHRPSRTETSTEWLEGCGPVRKERRNVSRGATPRVPPTVTAPPPPTRALPSVVYNKDPPFGSCRRDQGLHRSSYHASRRFAKRATKQLNRACHAGGHKNALTSRPVECQADKMTARGGLSLPEDWLSRIRPVPSEREKRWAECLILGGRQSW